MASPVTGRVPGARNFSTIPPRSKLQDYFFFFTLRLHLVNTYFLVLFLSMGQGWGWELEHRDTSDRSFHVAKIFHYWREHRDGGSVTSDRYRFWLACTAEEFIGFVWGHSLNLWEVWRTKLRTDWNQGRTDNKIHSQEQLRDQFFGCHLRAFGCSKYSLKCLWMFVSLS